MAKEGIWCEVRADLVNGRVRFRGLVRVHMVVKWRGQWRDTEREAQRDAVRMAEELYEANRDVLTIARVVGPRSVVSGFGIGGNPARRIH